MKGNNCFCSSKGSSHSSAEYTAGHSQQVSGSGHDTNFESQSLPARRTRTLAKTAPRLRFLQFRTGSKIVHVHSFQGLENDKKTLSLSFSRKTTKKLTVYILRSSISKRRALFYFFCISKLKHLPLFGNERAYQPGEGPCKHK